MLPAQYEGFWMRILLFFWDTSLSSVWSYSNIGS
jgi:hypothetical protein